MSTPSARKDHLDGLAVAILLACCLFWGFQQVLAKATIPEVPPVLQAARAAPHGWATAVLIDCIRLLQEFPDHAGSAPPTR